MKTLVAERLGGVEMIGDGDARSGGLTAQLFDSGRPRRDGGGVEAGRVEPLEQRQTLSAVLDHRCHPLDSRLPAVADGDVGDRVEAAVLLGRIPHETVAEHLPARRRAGRPGIDRILDNGHGSIMTWGCHRVRRTVPLGGFGVVQVSLGVEHLQLLPGDGDVADDPPAEPTPRAGASDLDPFGSQVPGGAVGVEEGDAAVELDARNLPDDPATLVVARNRIGSPPQPRRASDAGLRCMGRGRLGSDDAPLELAHAAEPSFVVGGLELQVVGDLGVGEDQERSASIVTATQATSAGSSTAPAAWTTLLPASASSPERSMLVFTPCGHRQLTFIPASP